MLEQLTIADFAPLVDQQFEVDLDGRFVPLTLVSTSPSTGGSPPRIREPFSLIFRGPPAPLLSQRMHTLRHTSFATLEIFLVPIGPDAQGQLYEAIFN